MHKKCALYRLYYSIVYKTTAFYVGIVYQGIYTIVHSVRAYRLRNVCRDFGSADLRVKMKRLYSSEAPTMTVQGKSEKSDMRRFFWVRLMLRIRRKKFFSFSNFFSKNS